MSAQTEKSGISENGLGELAVSLVTFSLLSRFHCKREIIANHVRVFAAAYIVSSKPTHTPVNANAKRQNRDARIEIWESKFGNRSLGLKCHKTTLELHGIHQKLKHTTRSHSFSSKVSKLVCLSLLQAMRSTGLDLMLTISMHLLGVKLCSVTCSLVLLIILYIVM